MVLIALFLFFNVFMFVLNQNTAFQDSASQANRLLANRLAEKFTLSRLTYNITGSTVIVSVNVLNVSPLSVLIESLWIKDSAVANPNCFNVPESVSLQPGQSAILTGAKDITGASSLDIGSCTSWFVTARGNTISTIQSESTIGSGSGNGACAAIIIGISGANTTSPFDLSKPLGGTGGSAAFAQLPTGITTSNANDFIIASLGIQNGFNRGTYANTIGVNNPPPAYTTITQVDASYSRCAALAYTTVSTAKYYTDPSISWNSNYKGTWGLILDAVKKSSSGGTFGFDNSFSTSATIGNTMTLTLTAHSANDVLYLSWIGNTGETITTVSTGGSSPSTSTWTPMRAQVSADNGAPHYLETWYATSTTAGTYTIILTLSSSGS